MTTATVLIPEEIKQELSRELITLDKQILSLKVIDTATYLQAGEIFTAIAAAEKRVKARLDPLCEKANETHKGLTKWRAEELEKYKPLKEHVNKEQTRWNIEQEAVRRAEEEKLRAEALKADEERRLAEALQAEKEGDKEMAETILTEPVFVPPPIVAKTVPKIAGQTLATTWKHRVVSLQMLCRAVAEGAVPINCIEANDVFLGQQARAGHGNIKYPGVEFYPEQNMRGART